MIFSQNFSFFLKFFLFFSQDFVKIALFSNRAVWEKCSFYKIWKKWKILRKKSYDFCQCSITIYCIHWKKSGEKILKKIENCFLQMIMFLIKSGDNQKIWVENSHFKEIFSFFVKMSKFSPIFSQCRDCCLQVFNVWMFANSNLSCVVFICSKLQVHYSNLHQMKQSTTCSV